MSRKSNLAVVEDSAVVEDGRQAHIEIALVKAKPARKPREPRAAFIGGDIEEGFEPPARLVKYTLADLLVTLPVGKSRVITGAKSAAVLRAAKALGLDVVTDELKTEPVSVRVWKMS